MPICCSVYQRIMSVLVLSSHLNCCLSSKALIRHLILFALRNVGEHLRALKSSLRSGCKCYRKAQLPNSHIFVCMRSMNSCRPTLTTLYAWWPAGLDREPDCEGLSLLHFSGTICVFSVQTANLNGKRVLFCMRFQPDALQKSLPT